VRMSTRSTRRPRRVGSQSSVLIAAAVSLLCSPSGHAGESFDALKLQREFSRAHDLQLIHSTQQLAPEVRAKVAHVSWLPGGLGELGAEWSRGDAVVPGLPHAQHLFSAASAKISAVFFVSGLGQPRYYVLLTHMDEPEYCLFSLPSVDVDQFRLSELQQLLRPDRVQMPPTPKCDVQSIAAPFHTP
jgi:hypothetical protein